MENNEELQWIVLVYGGIFLAAIALVTLGIAIACTIGVLLRGFPVLPVAMYWCFCGLMGASILFVPWYGAAWLFGIISPVFSILFWFYDRENTKRKHSLQASGHVNNY